MKEFELTYSSMYDPPPEFHAAFDRAVEETAAQLGAQHPLYIAGRWISSDQKIVKRSPGDPARVLGSFSLASVQHAHAAMEAATAASASWGRTPWPERVALARRVAEVIKKRMFEIAAAVSHEVGKSRMESVAEVQEVVDLFRLYASHVEDHGGYVRSLPADPVPGVRFLNRSVMKPYGPWVVIAPFNFPFALSAGPTAAALVTGNTVVLKASLLTPWSGVLLAQCLEEAGLPAGAFNYLLGDADVGTALTTHAKAGGITFTGSHRVGMEILREQATMRVPRPCITEMGGKNCAIVLPGADLDGAAKGIARSAFGLSGQKCSALSRLYVHEAVYDDLMDRVCAFAQTLRVGDPLARETFTGPVASAASYRKFGESCTQLSELGARMLLGGKHLTHEAEGFYCAPTIAEVPISASHWNEELFCPLLSVARVKSKDEAMAAANSTLYGLTAGFFGAEEDIPWFMESIEAGVTFANRALGATTGAWPGYQPFGGWKASGNTGKGLGSFYYVPQYMREQSQTIVN